MVIKDIVTGESAHKKVYSGIKKLAETVGSTFGPAGSNVSLQKDDGTLHCTKDGVTVAKEITFSDQVEYSATTYIKDIANNTVARAGDGTTTATLLAWMLYKLGRDEEGKPLAYVSPDFIKGLKDASKKATEYLKSIAIPAKEPEILEKVALLASNNDEEISSLLREAMKTLGETGNIFVEESKSIKTRLFTSPGMGLMKGFLSSHFINNPKRLTCELIVPYVLVTEDEIYSIFQLQNLFHQINEIHQTNIATSRAEVKTDMPHILIVCKKMKEDILGWVLTQHQFKVIQTCVIQADHISENEEQLEAWMEDLRLISGCQPIGGKFTKRLGTGEAQCNADDLGRLKKAVVNNEKSILIPLPMQSEQVKETCEGLKAQIEKETDDNVKVSLKQRLARLSDGIAILELGGMTEKAMKERIDRIEDAICAVMVAREGGVLPGGGLPYLWASSVTFPEYDEPCDNYDYMTDFVKGKILFTTALINLATYLFKSNHKDKKDIEDIHSKIVEVQKRKDKLALTPKEWTGVNLRTGETNVNLFEEGIVEPVKVNIEAIQNAVDIVSMLLNTNSFVIYDDHQEKKFIYPLVPQNNMNMGMMPNLNPSRFINV